MSRFIRKSPLGLMFVLLFLPACATVDPSEDFSRTRRLIMDSTGAAEVYDPDRPPLSSKQIDEILIDGLSLDEALGLALVNNRRLQAQFMRIGVARADWVQAGLLSNPSLEAAVMLPIDGGRSNIQASLGQNLVRLFRIPVNKRIAQQEIEQAVLTIARRAGELATEVRAAYFDAVAARGNLRVSRENLHIVDQSFHAIQRQQQAGIAGTLEENLGRGQVLNAELAVRNARLQASNALRKLAALLCLEQEISEITLTDGLDWASKTPPDAEELIRIAREHRLDLLAAKAEVDAGLAALSLERSKAFPDVSVGGSMERLERRGGEGDGIDLKAGPAFSLEIPLFDQNQAQVARAQFLHDQAVKQYEQLNLAIAQDLRMAADRSNTAQDNFVFYRDRLLPQAEQGFRLAADSFDAGRTSLLNLLESQRSLLEARRGLIEMQHQRVKAMIELELAAGTSLR